MSVLQADVMLAVPEKVTVVTVIVVGPRVTWDVPVFSSPAIDVRPVIDAPVSASAMKGAKTPKVIDWP